MDYPNRKQAVKEMQSLPIADDPDDLAAGDSDRMIEIEYTAAGQMVAGTVRLTVPGAAAPAVDDGWASASADNVGVTASTGAVLSRAYGADETAPTKLVTVDGVNLLAGQTITFAYTGGVGLVKKADVEFKVETNLASTDADYKADGFAAVASEDTDVKLDVGYARPGSGMGSVSQRVIDTRCYRGQSNLHLHCRWRNCLFGRVPRQSSRNNRNRLVSTGQHNSDSR